MLRIGNLFDIERTPGDGERFDTLLAGSNVTIERIVSAGHASPPGFWYDDPRAEWVVLLSGAAVLEFEHDAARHALHAGDHLLIDAHCRHRVAWTDPSVPTVWLAVYHEPERVASSASAPARPS
ncbi:cupin domain-containing protein [Burkholderia multivorans]|uniref:cupin domain-containing protein n=1 Tax=Burkholderia multivorans TaxID=87883 RepID=UPI0015900CDF|nr:cupin domain-containing protein [Burkholderia multivorans]